MEEDRKVTERFGEMRERENRGEFASEVEVESFEETHRKGSLKIRQENAILWRLREEKKNMVG